MPLPDPQPRRELHFRNIELRGFQREDGLFDIEGRLVDRKTYPFFRKGGDQETPPGTPLHDMWIRLVVDENLVVRDVVAVTDASPWQICREAVAPMAAVIGERIKPGWTNMVKQRLGGAKGCTHLMELLMPLATAAFQTIHPVRTLRPDPLDREGRPIKIDSCYAYASGTAIVRRFWPEFHTGPAKQPDLQDL